MRMQIEKYFNLSKYFPYVLLSALALIFLGAIQQNATPADNQLKIQNTVSRNTLIYNKILTENNHLKQTEKPIIKIPSNMQSPKALWHTAAVGTIDHPTLDGGIINAADNIPVYTPPPPKPVQVNADMSPNKVNEKLGIKFDDTWATSKKIKSALEQAAKTGKLNYVLTESSQKGLPASVALLPIVESGYQDHAISPKGAVGSWQLMSKTAQDYGLEPSLRESFIPSTDTALNLLNNLHQEFGNWELAFAAYNAGSARVKKAIEKTPWATSVDELDLPIETKNYVKELMKISHVLENQTSNENNDEEETKIET